MPSMNQSGMLAARGGAPRLSPVPPVMSYWKAWVSSWPMTWFRSPSVPPVGSTIRRRSASVTPPVPSPRPCDDVGLLELGLGGVEDERLPAGQLVVQHGAQAGVPALGHPAGELAGALLFGVVVDVEVLRSGGP